MANPQSIIAVESKLRLCKVGDKLGYFHAWEQCSDVVPPSIMRGGHQGGVVSQMYALVEFTDGIKRVQPWDIKFVDEKNDILKQMIGINE